MANHMNKCECIEQQLAACLGGEDDRLLPASERGREDLRDSKWGLLWILRWHHSGCEKDEGLGGINIWVAFPSWSLLMREKCLHCDTEDPDSLHSAHYDCWTLPTSTYCDTPPQKKFICVRTNSLKYFIIVWVKKMQKGKKKSTTPQDLYKNPII